MGPSALLLLALAPQKAGVVDLSPSLPPTAPIPRFVDASDQVTAGGAWADEGVGRGQAWVDVVGPDPNDPSNPAAVGPPDGILDLVQTNSNSPVLPFTPGDPTTPLPPSQQQTPAVGNIHSASLVWRGLPDGTFVEVADAMCPTQPSGFSIAYPGGSPWGVVAADFDADGLADLFYPCGGFNTDSPNSLFRAVGDGTFVNDSASMGISEVQASAAALWLDPDLDGDLDLYVANMAADQFWAWVGSPIVDPTDRLYRNEDGHSFTEVAAVAGCDLKSSGFSASSADLDLNGAPDIAVSCYKQYNKLFYGRGDGTFDFLMPAGSPSPLPLPSMADMVADPGLPGSVDFPTLPGILEQNLPVRCIWSMPVVLEDFNADGWTDICYGAFSWQLDDGIPGTAQGGQFSPWEYSRFYLNQGDSDGDGLGDGRFYDVTTQVGFTHVGGCMGQIAGDFNADGFMDVYLGGGGPVVGSSDEEDYVYLNEPSAWPENWLDDPPNTSIPQAFYEVGALVGSYGNKFMAHGVTATVGAQGRVDLLVGNGGPAASNDGQANIYYRNEGNLGGEPDQFVLVDLEPVLSPPGGIGARVEMLRSTEGVGRLLVRERRSGTGFSSSDAGPLTFGATDQEPLFLSVRWPSGVRSGRSLLPDAKGIAHHLLVEPTLSIAIADLGQPNLVLKSYSNVVQRGALVLERWTPSAQGPHGQAFTPAGSVQGEHQAWVLAETQLLSNQLAVAPGQSLSLPLPVDPASEGLLVARLEPAAGEPWEAAAFLGSGQLPAQAPASGRAADAPPTEAELRSTRRRWTVRETLGLRAAALEVMPARWPLEPVRFEAGENRRLALPSGDELIWHDGRASLRVLDSPGGLVQLGQDDLVILLGAPLGCCDATAREAQPTLVRFEGLEGEDLRLDGRDPRKAGR